MVHGQTHSRNAFEAEERGEMLLTRAIEAVYASLECKKHKVPRREVREFLERNCQRGWHHVAGPNGVRMVGYYGSPGPGWHQVAAGWDLAGALTFAFPSTAARLLLADPVALNHRRLGPSDGRAYIDAVVGRWAAQAGLPVYYHFPSLAQHVGDASTVWEGARNQGQRCSASFVGEDFDALSLAGAMAHVTRMT
jgi:hypothetical protein